MNEAALNWELPSAHLVRISEARKRTRDIWNASVSHGGLSIEEVLVPVAEATSA